MRILRIGDPHAKPNNLLEVQKLMEFAVQMANDNRVDRIEILGDLHHSHAVIRLETLEFWNFWLEQLSIYFETVVLVGNHDCLSSSESRLNSLNIYKRINNKNLTIVDQPIQKGIFLYVPYIHQSEKFIESVSKFDTAKVLVCHQTFSGSVYDNGFYAPDGVNPDLINIPTIICGHIHKQQVVANGKVDYPGTSKWDTANDANEKKGLWLYEHDDVSGVVLARTLIPTDNICTPIYSFSWQEGWPEPTLPENSNVTIELIGSSDWIAKQKLILKDRASIKSKITDKKKTHERKSSNSLEDFMLNLYVSTMDKQALYKYAKELGIV